MLLFVSFDKLMPLGFKLFTALNRFAEVRESFVGNVKLLVFGPAEMPLRFFHCVFARRIAMSFARALCRHAEPDNCLNGDEARLVSD